MSNTRGTTLDTLSACDLLLAPGDITDDIAVQVLASMLLSLRCGTTFGRLILASDLLLLLGDLGDGCGICLGSHGSSCG